jgi:pyruvate dehydrogenase E2 component (dihydrolipoamide acetyltransferase)
MQEATIVAWRKEDGARVKSGDEIVDVETDKVEVAIEAPTDGVLSQQVSVGDVVPVGGVLAIVTAEEG